MNVKWLIFDGAAMKEFGHRVLFFYKKTKGHMFLIIGIYTIWSFLFISFKLHFLSFIVLKEFLNIQDENQQLKKIYHEQEQALQELGSKLSE